MGKCIDCKLEILDETQMCPFCHSALLPTDEEENVYPNVQPHSSDLSVKFNTYLFTAGLLWGRTELYHILKGLKHQWSIAAGAVLFCVCICVIWSQAVNNRISYRNKAVIIASMSTLFLMGIDHSLGFDGWSISLVIPIGLLLTVFLIACCMLRDYRNWQSYISGQLCTMLFSFLVWGICCWTEKGPYLTALAFVLSLILFFGTVTIGGYRARMELKRRFHTH